VEGALARRPAVEWQRALAAAGVPAEVSSDRASAEMWEDAEALAQSWVARYPHPVVQEIGQVGLAFEFSETPPRVQGAPFIVGADTRAILAELGYDDARVDLLMEVGAVGDERVNPMLAAGEGEGAQSPWAPDD